MSSPATPSPATVLIADDHDSVRAVASTFLAQAGFRVLVAADGREALDLYLRHRPEVAVALLDCRMPGLKGPAVMEAIHQIDPSLPCCLMSGQYDATMADELLRRGAARVFPKPLDFLELVNAIRALCPA
jgi:two-component system cell cycle sensor histidine kinase/response regulator CckA